jgi:MarR family transcriptional regulator, organic hydroperoxide resistance regulator
MIWRDSSRFLTGWNSLELTNARVRRTLVLSPGDRAEPFTFPLDISRDNDYSACMSRRAGPSAGANLPLEDRIFVSLQKTADLLGQDGEQLLKPHGLTGTQYNVLRILRGSEPHGLPCSGIGERMISHDPDMTRLLDRMEKRALISRQRQTDDRRVVKARITQEGLSLLRSLDQPVREMHKLQFRHMAAARLRKLAELLEEVRARPAR